MNSLKKALTKDDIKKYQKKNNNNAGNLTKINHNSISNRNNWTDINQFIQSRDIYKKSNQNPLNDKLTSLIYKSFQFGKLTVNQQIFIKSLLSIFQQYNPDQQFDFSRNNFNHKQQKILHLLELLQRLYQQQSKKYKSMKSINIEQCCENYKNSVELVKKYLQNEVTKRKNKQLDDFDKILNAIKPPKKKEQKKQQKRQNIQKLNKKLLSSLSSGNLHIKVTTQQISIQNVNNKGLEKNIQKKKSQSKMIKVQSDKRLKSPKNQGQIKLQNFLKDPNYKIVKTKIQYDYSAILQGSKGNLQFRNKTIQPDIHKQSVLNQTTVKNNFQVTNINKAKKDQAFVFYRPKPNKNSNKQK